MESPGPQHHPATPSPGAPRSQPRGCIFGGPLLLEVTVTMRSLDPSSRFPIGGRGKGRDTRTLTKHRKFGGGQSAPKDPATAEPRDAWRACLPSAPPALRGCDALAGCTSSAPTSLSGLLRASGSLPSPLHV